MAAPFVATAYGPPWGGIQGTGVTATGVDLRANPHRYVVAVDPSVIPLGSRLRVSPNPFGDPNLVFTAADTGGAIKGNRLDFFDPRGRQSQYAFGRKTVTVSVLPSVGAPASAQAVAAPAGPPAVPPPARPAAGLDAILSPPPPVSRANGPGLDAVLGMPAAAARPFFARAKKGQEGPSGLDAVLSPAPGSSTNPLTEQMPTPGTTISGYPLATPGKLIGVPYKGTHTLYGNWESDNAVDLAVPVGTPVVALSDGTIGSQIGPLNTGGDPHLEGLRLHLVTPGDEFYYAHLSRIVVKPGERVRAGQIIGYSGEANGVAHLHLGEKSGNPLVIAKSAAT